MSEKKEINASCIGMKIYFPIDGRGKYFVQTVDNNNTGRFDDCNFFFDDEITLAKFISDTREIVIRKTFEILNGVVRDGQ